MKWQEVNDLTVIKLIKTSHEWREVPLNWSEHSTSQQHEAHFYIEPLNNSFNGSSSCNISTLTVRLLCRIAFWRDAETISYMPYFSFATLFSEQFLEQSDVVPLQLWKWYVPYRMGIPGALSLRLYSIWSHASVTAVHYSVADLDTLPFQIQSLYHAG